MLSADVCDQANLIRRLAILFVEDDADVRESMASYLGRRVARIHTAKNGATGLGLFKELRPDLVISDIRMGEMDGIAMCRAIREIEPDIPVIFISAHNESEILLSSIDLGITKFIVKPVDTDVLMDTISSVAQSIDRRHDLASRLRQMDLMLNEADYENECIKNYVSGYLEANHHDGLANIRHLGISKLEVSGDFYCVAKHRDDLYVMLADGAGHGVSAVIPALQMPRIFRQRAERGFSLLTVAAEINRLLYEQHFVGYFVATTMLRINPGERFIEVLNCSNPPALIFDAKGRQLRACHSRSAALGMLSDEQFSPEVERFCMDRSVRIYLYSDGLIDTLQANMPDFDETELQSMFGNVGCADVFAAVADKVGEAARISKADDVTLLEICCDCDTPSAQQTYIQLDPELSLDAELPVPLDQITLLYVEDDDLARDYLSLYLNRRLGMVYVARDGQEGLELFRKHKPQIVLSDIRMPQMDGLEMAEEIRRMDKEVPIIVTSGSDNAEDAEKMFEMGVSRFHLKPLDTDKLINNIQTCIRQAKTLNRLRLSASAFQASSLAVITVDRDRRIIDVNPAFCRITGYTLADVYGQSPTLLSYGKYDASHYVAMWHELEESGSWSGELRCHHKSGTEVSEWLTVNAVKGMDGVLTGYHFIFSDISERKINEETVRLLSQFDSLTQLQNRTMFANRVNDLLEQDKTGRQSLAMVYINIDRFIEINKGFGVRVGDEVLSAVAQRLRAGVGVSDEVCRLGGDEFAVMLRQAGGRDMTERAVAELAHVIKQPIEVDGKEIYLQVRFGISLYPSDGASYEELFKSACCAMNQAQRAGGDTYCFFDKSVSQQEERQVALQQGIKSGLQKAEFYMLYQPKYSIGQQRVVGAEALVRWLHPSYGLISPVEFIPLAEGSGAVIELSEWIIDAVCAQLAKWRSLGLPQVPVSINISPLHFWRGDLVGALQHGLQKWDIHPSMLPIEVTEGVVMDTSARTLQVLAELKALGFHLSIDDFGTGYSSLKYLKDLPISELKIDRSFIIGIPEEGQPDDLSRTAIPRAIIQLASELNLTVVAEGVETENQKNFLFKNGCDVIQGFTFSPPIHADEFALLLS